MALLGCTPANLISASNCYACLNDTDLLRGQVRYRELIYSKRANLPVRTGSQLFSAAVAWTRLSAHQLLAVDVLQLGNDAMNINAITAASAQANLNATACYCGIGDGDLKAINAYLSCLIRNLG